MVLKYVSLGLATYCMKDETPFRLGPGVELPSQKSVTNHDTSFGHGVALTHFMDDLVDKVWGYDDSKH